MHNIVLNVNNTAYEHLIYFLSHLKDDVEVLKDEICDTQFEIDTNHCKETLEKIENDKVEDFKPIESVDRHIEALMNDIS
jgi:hypothetical protein